MLYLAELLMQDPSLHFKYINNICLYCITKSFNHNVKLLASNMQDIIA
jgi:hypothetical protein